MEKSKISKKIFFLIVLPRCPKAKKDEPISLRFRAGRTPALLFLPLPHIIGKMNNIGNSEPILAMIFAESQEMRRK
jgi:hypothetical protein